MTVPKSPEDNSTITSEGVETDENGDPDSGGDDGRLFAPINNYREWVMAKSIGGRLLIVVGAFFFLTFVGLIVGSGTLQATIGTTVTQIVVWVAFLFVLYTLYAVVRSAVAPIVAAIRNRSSN